MRRTSLCLLASSARRSNSQSMPCLSRVEEVRKLFQHVRGARQRKGLQGRRKVQAYLRMARLLVARAEQSRARLHG